MSEAMIRTLTQGKATDSDIERALSEAGNRFALDYLTLQPWATAYNQSLSQFQQGWSSVFDLAIMGREGVYRAVKARPNGPQFVPVVERAIRALFCRYPDKPLPQGAETPGFTFYDICPTPSL